MNSPRYAPAGLLVEQSHVRVAIDGGPGAEPAGPLAAWLVTDECAELIRELRRLAAAHGLVPAVSAFHASGLTITPRAVVHTSHPAYGYLIEADDKRTAWAPEFLEFPWWAAGVDLMFAEAAGWARPIRFARGTGGHASALEPLHSCGQALSSLGPAACWAPRSAAAPTPSSRWPRTCWAASARAWWCSRTASSCPGPPPAPSSTPCTPRQQTGPRSHPRCSAWSPICSTRKSTRRWTCGEACDLRTNLELPTVIPPADQQRRALLVHLSAVPRSRSFTPLQDTHERQQQRVGTKRRRVTAVIHKRFSKPVSADRVPFLRTPFAYVLLDLLVAESSEPTTSEMVVIQLPLFIAHRARSDKHPAPGILSREILDDCGSLSAPGRIEHLIQPVKEHQGTPGPEQSL
jgi:hypothetical protein